MLRLSEKQLTNILARQPKKTSVISTTYDLPGFVVDSLELASRNNLISPLIPTLNIGLKALLSNDSKPKPYERLEQTISLVWLAINSPEAYEVSTATPFGGYRPDGAGGQLKGEGVRAGYPDYLVDMPMRGYHGLRIEMKKFCKHANASDDQVSWLTKLNQQGYRAVLCRGHQAAIYVLATYLNIPPPYPLSSLPDWAIETF